MNTVKLYRLNRNGVPEVRRVRCTQSTKHWHARAKRTLPYPHEVYAWADRNGWSLNPVSVPTTTETARA